MDKIVNLVDSPMGTGKTTWAIQYINKLPKDTKVIYITPFLAETERIKEECPRKGFVLPDKNKAGSKSKHFLSLIQKDANIASTHALFAGINEETIEALRQRDYVLILDEAFDVVAKFDLWKYDKDFKNCSDDEKDELTRTTIKSLINKKCIEIRDDFLVKWIDLENPQPKYSILKNLCDRELLYAVNQTLLVWTFPVDLFEEGIFEEVYILTHRFTSQIQSYYFKYFNIKYNLYHVEKWGITYGLVETKDDNFEREWIQKIKNLIHIEQGSVNKKGIFLRKNKKELTTALSLNWHKNNIHKINGLQKGMVTFFLNHSKGKGSERMWTTFKSYAGYYKHSQVSMRNWVPFNSRSTNLYRDKKYIAYCVNRYIDPFFIDFFLKRNIKVDQDEFALSEMLQFIFRSAIRDGKEVYVYIPSRRMRELLESYLDGNLNINHFDNDEYQETIISSELEIEFD